MTTVAIAEGKTKIIWENLDKPGFVLIESKDDITAGDGAQHDELEGKAVAATTTTVNTFKLLEYRGIDTHFEEQVGPRTFEAARIDMIPLELVVRRVATGSYLKRHTEAVEGEIFKDLVFEVFHKDDDAHDPILRFDFKRGVAERYPAGVSEFMAKPIDEISLESLKLQQHPAGVLQLLRAQAIGTFAELERAWAEQDVQLVDLKIECGWDGLAIVVADVIDNDSWRIWPGGDKTQMKDKQVYRDLAGVEDPKAKAKELGKIKQNYQEVAERTNRFCELY